MTNQEESEELKFTPERAARIRAGVAEWMMKNETGWTAEKIEQYLANHPVQFEMLEQQVSTNYQERKEQQAHAGFFMWVWMLTVIPAGAILMIMGFSESSAMVLAMVLAAIVSMIFAFRIRRQRDKLAAVREAGE